MPEALAHQFDTIEQQRQTSKAGMWVFLASEVLFFGVMFTAYVEYRFVHPRAFEIGSGHMDYLLGTLNTGVLLVSSLTMALAVHAAQIGRRGLSALFLTATILLGALFLGIKGHEYIKHYHEGLVPGAAFSYEGPHAREVSLFMSYYFVMTGMHALHMIIGIGLLTTMVLMTLFGRFSREYHTPVVITALFWHLVDIVWIFLYPSFYLVGTK